MRIWYFKAFPRCRSDRLIFYDFFLRSCSLSVVFARNTSLRGNPLQVGEKESTPYWARRSACGTGRGETLPPPPTITAAYRNSLTELRSLSGVHRCTLQSGWTRKRASQIFRAPYKILYMLARAYSSSILALLIAAAITRTNQPHCPPPTVPHSTMIPKVSSETDIISDFKWNLLLPLLFRQCRKCLLVLWLLGRSILKNWDTNPLFPLTILIIIYLIPHFFFRTGQLSYAPKTTSANAASANP